MKSIIVTGASSGVGLATAQKFLAEGWTVGLVARRAEPLEAVARDNANALALPCDVADDAAVDAAFDRFAAETGHLDAVFNNAGRGLPATPPDEISPADWRAVVDVNLNGLFYCARAAFRVMRHQKPQGGRIINNGSISAETPRVGSAAYTATKHAVTGLTKSFALDGRPFDIACGQIDIGNAATPMTERMKNGVPQPNGEMMVEPRMDVAHVADMVHHMAMLPLDANVLRVTVMATKMPLVGRG